MTFRNLSPCLALIHINRALIQHIKWEKITGSFWKCITLLLILCFLYPYASTVTFHLTYSITVCTDIMNQFASGVIVIQPPTSSSISYPEEFMGTLSQLRKYTFPPLQFPHFSQHTYTLTHTHTHGGRIVLIYPASSINHIISNNCHRQLGSQLRDFILIDFRTCSQLWMIWFPSDTMFIKGILHKGINGYCWLDLYELGKNAEIRPLF